jgi:2-desacetyl-2-hydroxyethyl bacteriochlorophyllide A dehydrogenase
MTPPTGDVRTGDYEARPLAEGEALLRVSYSGISPGTETRANAGKQSPDLTPFVPGYGATGVVIDGPGDWVGKRVFSGGSREVGPHQRMWGGHQSHVIQNVDMLTAVPDAVDDRSACLAKLVAIALHGTRVVGDVDSREVAIVGLGAIGHFAAQCWRAAGAKVVATDRSVARVEAIRAAGVEAVVADGRPMRELLAGHFPDGPEIIVDATGSPRVVPDLIDAIRTPPWHQLDPRRPVYVIQGSMHGDFAFNQHDAFSKELTFVLPRDQTPHDLRDALAMMADGRVTVEHVLSEVLDPAEAQTAYRRLQDPDDPAITFAFDWRG